MYTANYTDKAAFSELSETELNALYHNFCEYRDNVCNGKALMTVGDFYGNFGLSKFKPYEWENLDSFLPSA